MLIGIDYEWDNLDVGGKVIEHAHLLYYPEIKHDDIVDYLTPNALPSDCTNIYRRGINKALEYVDFDKLEDDIYFIAFIKERYEDDAKEYFCENYIYDGELL